MNNETEELLDRINNYPEKLYCLNENEKHLLLDYITNLQTIEREYSTILSENAELQQEIKEANDSITWWSNRFKAVERDNRELKQENEYLKLSNPEMNMEHFRIIDENRRKINNLRKQNKELQQAVKDTKDSADDMLYELKQENETLKSDFKNQVEYTNGIAEEARDYKSRCEKAIEYVKNNPLYEVLYDDNGNYFNTTDSQETDDLLNILQNGSEEK